MEMKVWVEGIQRVVCGVTEKTTCQEIVIALAQATGKTGRFTLVEKWRDMERLVPPTEAPFKNVAKWGQYANDVTYFLRKSGSTKKRPSSAKPAPPERTFLRQSLPPKAVSKEGFANQRKEPLRKSLNSQVSAKADFEAKEFQEKVTHHPDRSYDDLMKIVRFQQDKLNFQKCQLTKLDSEIRDYELIEETVSSNQSQELGRLESLGKEYERQLQSLEIVEMELARELAERDRLQTDITRVQAQIADTEKQLQQFLAKVDKLMQEIDQEKEKQKISNESAKEQEQQLSAEIQDLKKEIAQQLEEHNRYSKELSQVEEQIKDVENEIDQKNKNLEVLGKELKNVNFQDFVKTTGYIVEVPPTATNGDSPPIADVDVPNKTTPTQDPKTQDTKTVLVTSRPNSARKILNPRELQSAVPTTRNPEGIWV
ncbi:ras association domain-containing protein 8-like isoform X1 [Branchiostoma floridae]|uniref:Ras association domain-containing protein 8-like isoform X1 n=1 Tax=Branchiostoma floridae TaxID=7739 RepID=A0A9J7L0K0_BRAFL|nr:ras association domain-containing protein 8-like isoform X1 [Branchiostoma floridae]XP_035673704.1 ras association domain-containing protein 8-like isoform X1 [Branchiostoma floridae]XP_035673705.1 ras association domain-containing protein 8-like isoform X1 [Branchiostoma floridae]XP_035673706.1 ras association domain-containing protein 8-like isoform X1 [Branchiostoma floridae]XP_035673707.1 ras association domain-containing protein 8-like isoform X1 [Branchiostoma floridae]